MSALERAINEALRELAQLDARREERILWTLRGMRERRAKRERLTGDAGAQYARAICARRASSRELKELREREAWRRAFRELREERRSWALGRLAKLSARERAKREAREERAKREARELAPSLRRWRERRDAKRAERRARELPARIGRARERAREALVIAAGVAELRELERLESEARARGQLATARSWRERARQLREELAQREGGEI